ncbi:SoxR reducing system RseC family protein [Gallaecimonas sp. GXIMD4217]|uniref:SoxR reducing system RseC family protein n=1 Tax=Gallaecimonas sp. GXIMD4217 TaxID=3131927 RepID=UPI00311B2481
MIIRDAEVVAVKGRAVTVAVLRQSSCDGCQAADDCGTGQVSKALAGKLESLTFHTDEPVVKGDWVRLGIPEDSLIKGALLVYLMPILAVLLALLLVAPFLKILALPELYLLPVVVLSGWGAFALARRLAPSLVREPQLVSVLGPAGKRIEVMTPPPAFK